MKTIEPIAASTATLIASAFAFADTTESNELGFRPNSQEIAALFLGGHDRDNDGALSGEELARSIESLYEMRDEAIYAHRQDKLESGTLSEDEFSEGFVTMSLMPSDAAALMMKKADANENLVLEADELIAVAGSIRSFDLGTGPRSLRRS